MKKIIMLTGLASVCCHAAQFELPETPRPAMPMELAPPGWPEPTFIPEPCSLALISSAIVCVVLTLAYTNRQEIKSWCGVFCIALFILGVCSIGGLASLVGWHWLACKCCNLLRDTDGQIELEK
jgi:hypothetical protein